jgi:hypothetical protein
MYRVNRLDVSSDVPVTASLDEQLEYCRRHVVRVNLRWRTVPPDEVGWIGRLRKYGRRLSRGVAYRISIFPQATSRAIKNLPVAIAGAAAGVVEAVVWIVHHPFKENLRVVRYYVRKAVDWLLSPLDRLTQLFGRRMMKLHTNACGDFTLLSRDEWFRLRGYPEWHMYSFHMDSILCYMAHYDGIREVVLKRNMGVYHIDHHSGWSPEGADVLANRMRSMGVPIMDYVQLCALVARMHRGKSPLVSNDEDWGLASEELVETNPMRGLVTSVEGAEPRRQAVRP